MKSIKRRFSILIFLLLFCMVSEAQLWQWSIPVKGGINKNGPSRAFLWIPPHCANLRGVVLAQNNMEELSVIENTCFRDSMASIQFGIIWVSPAFDILFNVPGGAGKTFIGMMHDLAVTSGYNELKFVPVVSMGHSASSNFPHSFAAWFPERALCGISISGVFPYDFTNMFARNTWEGRNVDFIPSLVTMGEYEGSGSSSANFDRIFSRREAHPFTPMSLLPCAGEYHFATSQKKTDFIAYYIKKAVFYRLLKDATDSTFATLKPIDPTITGWLVDRWRKNEKPRYQRNPVAIYTGIKKEAFWCFDADMAKRIEDYENAYFCKRPCLLAYVQNGRKVPQTNNHVQVSLKFIPLNDSLDFKLSSSFLDTVASVSGRLRGWTDLPVGSPIGYPSNPALSSIDRTIGPFIKLGYDPATRVTTFRMQLEPGLASAPVNYKNTTIFSLTNPGDAVYKPSVLQADMSIPVKNTEGVLQVINFPQQADVTTKTVAVQLNAVSDKGLPVQYFVREGPVQLKGNKLVLTNIPPKSHYPVKVTVIAWQWGRNSELAALTAGTSAPLAGKTVQTAQPVVRSFYISH